MTIRHLLLAGATAALLAAPAAVASAQTMTPMPTWNTTPRQLETFYTEYRLDTGDQDDRVRTEGIGARMMWQLPADPEANTLRSRTSVGLAASYARQSIGPTLTTQYVGAETDVHLLPEPIAGRLSPFVGFGIGALRTNRTIPAVLNPHGHDRMTVSLAVAPAAGMRLELGRGLGLRADVRDVITFNDGARHNPAFGVGLSLQF